MLPEGSAQGRSLSEPTCKSRAWLPADVAGDPTHASEPDGEFSAPVRDIPWRAERTVQLGRPGVATP